MKRLHTNFWHTVAQTTGLVVLTTTIAMLVMPMSVFAQFSTQDIKDSKYWPFYDSSLAGSNGCSASTSSVSVPAGTLPSFIPEPYNGAFTQGANNNKVAPALVAAIFSEEHN